MSYQTTEEPDDGAYPTVYESAATTGVSFEFPTNGFLPSILTTNTNKGDAALLIVLILLVLYWPRIIGTLRLTWRKLTQKKQKKHLI
jgi:hypothetical protein